MSFPYLVNAKALYCSCRTTHRVIDPWEEIAAAQLRKSDTTKSNNKKSISFKASPKNNSAIKAFKYQMYFVVARFWIKRFIQNLFIYLNNTLFFKQHIYVFLQIYNHTFLEKVLKMNKHPYKREKRDKHTLLFTTFKRTWLVRGH